MGGACHKAEQVGTDLAFQDKTVDTVCPNPLGKAVLVAESGTVVPLLTLAFCPLASLGSMLRTRSFPRQ